MGNLKCEVHSIKAYIFSSIELAARIDTKHEVGSGMSYDLLCAIFNKSLWLLKNKQNVKFIVCTSFAT